MIKLIKKAGNCWMIVRDRYSVLADSNELEDLKHQIEVELLEIDPNWPIAITQESIDAEMGADTYKAEKEL